MEILILIEHENTECIIESKNLKLHALIEALGYGIDHLIEKKAIDDKMVFSDPLNPIEQSDIDYLLESYHRLSTISHLYQCDKLKMVFNIKGE